MLINSREWLWSTRNFRNVSKLYMWCSIGVRLRFACLHYLVWDYGLAAPLSVRLRLAYLHISTCNTLSYSMRRLQRKRESVLFSWQISTSKGRSEEWCVTHVWVVAQMPPVQLNPLLERKSFSILINLFTHSYYSYFILSGSEEEHIYFVLYPIN